VNLQQNVQEEDLAPPLKEPGFVVIAYVCASGNKASWQSGQRDR